ncbi:MAG: MFS transporter [Candidatus Hydrogenedentota bacterium]
MKVERIDETGHGEGVIPLSGKLAFGVGAVGESMFFGLFGVFIMIYYNQAIGLSASLIGTAIMLAMIGDAISDPVVGIVSDRWRSKFGRRHPFLLAAPLPLALSIYCIFNPPKSITVDPDGSTEMYLFAWLTVWTILSRMFVTLYHVPHLALGGEMTKDQHQRSQLFSVNSIFTFGTLATFMFVAFRYFFGDDRIRESDGQMVPGHLDPAAYDPLVFTACVAVLITIWGCAAGTWRYIPSLSAPPSNPQPISPLTFIKAVGKTLKNRNYMVLVIGFFFFMLTSGIYDTLEVFMFTYFWELKTEQMAWLRLVGAPAAVSGAFLSPILMRRFDRKPVMLTSLAGGVIFAQLMVDLRLLGLMVENGSSALLPILLVNRFGFAFCIGVSTVVMLSMIGDIIDDNELETGERQEGLYYSARSFFAKASSSFGIFFAGMVLEHFVQLPSGAIPGELDSDVVRRLGIMAGPVMAVAAVISLFIYSRYSLNRERHQEISKLLKERAVSNEDADA